MCQASGFRHACSPAIKQLCSRKKMDYSPIVAQIWGMLTWFIPAALLIGLLKSPWAKGHIGELLVRLFAHWQLDKRTYRRLHNVTLNTPDGTRQISHVFLSPYGIFVLETKNMSGWIYGNEKQASGRRSSTNAPSNSRIRCGRTTNTSKHWKPPLVSAPSTCTRSSPSSAAAPSKPKCRPKSPRTSV